MQRLGRRLAARLDARFGPDTLRPRRTGLAPAAEFTGQAESSGRLAVLRSVADTAAGDTRYSGT
jgi:hypothetical protein